MCPCLRAPLRHSCSWPLLCSAHNSSPLALLNSKCGRKQVAFLDALLEKLQGDTRDKSSPLYHQLDLARLAVAGHSRGGKLAALHFARTPLAINLSLNCCLNSWRLRLAYAA